MSATAKQQSYITHLMVDAGHASAKGGLYGSAKSLPNNPTMRERGAGLACWLQRLTPREASEVIDALKAT